jgi:lipopolysaccharide/colanic/teichoic acid biosynthesis glycosyltransferase
MKHILDILIAVLLLPLVFLICFPVSLLIFLEVKSNPFFLQKRVGKTEKIFTLYKMRSMYVGTESLGTHAVSVAKVTKIGRIIRKTKIDELPQVINVLLGQMSFVGPRPCLPNQTDLIAHRRERGVFTALPGITGLAQVAGIDMSEPERLATVDATYIATRSLFGDLRLMMQTAKGGGQGDAVRMDAD